MPTIKTLPEKVLDHVGYSSAALEKAATARKAHQTKQAEVKSLIPQVCDVLIEHERITPDQREKLAAALEDPARVLELMIKVAGHRNATEMAVLGQGVGSDGQVKTAAANGYDPKSSLSDPRLGRRGGMVKESSVRLFQGLGLTPPTEE